MSKDISSIHRKHLADPEIASEYLNEAFESGDQAEILLALRNLAEAQNNGVSGVAARTNASRASLYKTLSKNGNPKLDNLSKLLHSMGLQLCVKPEGKQKSHQSNA